MPYERLLLIPSIKLVVSMVIACLDCGDATEACNTHPRTERMHRIVDHVDSTG